MKYTTKYMKKLFDHINDELFRSKLDMPYFHVLNCGECKKLWPEPFDGMCVPDGSDYWIGIHKDLTTKEFFDTMVHEMIHIHLMNKNGYSGHGKPFKKWCIKAMETYYWRIL